MSKLTLEEKRLQNLRRQLFGKQTLTPVLKENTTKVSLKSSGIKLSPVSSTTSAAYLKDASFLKRDLLKILMLISAALALQLSLYFGSQNGLIRLGF